ncbi:hypothetical protein Tco_0496223 [Tanacetum coccineum]
MSTVGRQVAWILGLRRWGEGCGWRGSRVLIGGTGVPVGDPGVGMLEGDWKELLEDGSERGRFKESADLTERNGADAFGVWLGEWGICSWWGVDGRRAVGAPEWLRWPGIEGLQVVGGGGAGLRGAGASGGGLGTEVGLERADEWRVMLRMRYGVCGVVEEVVQWRFMSSGLLLVDGMLSERLGLWLLWGMFLAIGIDRVCVEWGKKRCVGSCLCDWHGWAWLRRHCKWVGWMMAGGLGGLETDRDDGGTVVNGWGGHDVLWSRMECTNWNQEEFVGLKGAGMLRCCACCGRLFSG